MTEHLYDLHTHTDCSPDSHQPIEGLCAAAARAGLAGIAVTDHGDSSYVEEYREAGRLVRSAQNAGRMAAQWAGRLEVLRGIEIGEGCWSPAGERTLAGLADYDVVIGSIHGFKRAGTVLFYSQEPFDAAHYTDAGLQAFLQRYLEAMAENAAAADYDVLAHLDCPLRYINGKYGRSADILAFPGLIDDVLRAALGRGKTLEVNTSGCARGAWGHRMPSDAVVRRWRELGGERVSLGSDAHAAENVAAGFEEAVGFLRGLGFSGETVYRGRVPFTVPFGA